MYVINNKEVRQISAVIQLPQDIDTLLCGMGMRPRVPQWSDQKRPTVVRSKPANGRSPGLDSFNPSSLDPASLFSFSSSVVRISGCDRGVADGRAWR